MPQTIILKNQTPNSIPIDDIALTVPGSFGQITASDFLTPEEIRRSIDLQAQIDGGTIVIDDGTNELSTSSSQAFMNGGDISPAVPGSLAEQNIQQTVLNQSTTILSQADAIVSTQPDLVVTSGTKEIRLSLLAPPTRSSAVQARRTTSLDNIPLSWIDITLDTTDVQTNTDVLEHDSNNTDRIQIKADGLYQITYAGDVDDEGEVRVRVNDATVLPGSVRVYGNVADAVDLNGPLVNIFFAELSAGDFVTPQIQATTTAENLRVDFTFCVVRYDGAQGPEGPVGPPGTADKKQFHGFLNSSNVALGSSFTPVPIDTQVIASGFTHTPGNANILFDQDMLADITYYLTTDNVSGGTRSESASILQEDVGAGFVDIIGTEARLYHRNSSQGATNAAVRIIRQFSKGDELRLAARVVSGSFTLQAVNQRCGITIVDSEAAGAQGNTGPQGPIGPTGPQGGPGNPNPALVGNFPITVVSGSNVLTLNSVGVGGSEFIRSDGESTTTSTFPVQKVRLTTSSLSAGTYRIGWSFEYGRDGSLFGSTAFNGRVQLDDTIDLASYSPLHNGAAAGNFYSASGFDYRTLTAGVHTVDIDFWGSTTGNTSRIRNARIEILRTA